MKTTSPWRWRPGSSHPTNEIFLRPKQLQTEDNILPVFNIIVYRSLRRCYYIITCMRDGTGKSHRVGRLKGTVGRRPARERTWSNHLMYPNTGDWSAKYLPCHLPSTICKHATPLHLRNYYEEGLRNYRTPVGFVEWPTGFGRKESLDTRNRRLETSLDKKK